MPTLGPFWQLRMLPIMVMVVPSCQPDHHTLAKCHCCEHPFYAAHAVMLCSSRNISKTVTGVENSFLMFWWCVPRGVLSNNPHSLTYQVSNINRIAFDIPNRAASGSTYPSPLFMLVAPFHWQLLWPLRYLSAMVWEVVYVPFLWVQFGCKLHPVPWCTALLVLPQLLMSWHAWWCGQCSRRLHCLLVWWYHWRGRSVLLHD